MRTLEDSCDPISNPLPALSFPPCPCRNWGEEATLARRGERERERGKSYILNAPLGQCQAGHQADKTPIYSIHCPPTEVHISGLFLAEKETGVT
jgi:hypothetical protein